MTSYGLEKQLDLLEKLVVGQLTPGAELYVDSLRTFDARKVFRKPRFPRIYSFIIRVYIQDEGDLLVILNRYGELEFAIGVRNDTLYIDYREMDDVRRWSVPGIVLQSRQWLELALGFGGSQVSVFLGCKPRPTYNASVVLNTRTGIRPRLLDNSLVLGYKRVMEGSAFQVGTN